MNRKKFITGLVALGAMPAAAGSLLSVLPARAAEVGPGKAAVCELKLEGPIEAGDGEKLSAALSALGSSGGFDSLHVRLCLNSLGGNYDEALKLMTVLLTHTNVATVVDAGAECYSACAFLFLAGNAQASEDGELTPNRTLDVRGTLGFHAPYLQTGTGPDVAAATVENFRRGVSAIAKMLEIDRRGLIPRGLLAKALQVGATLRVVGLLLLPGIAQALQGGGEVADRGVVCLHGAECRPGSPQGGSRMAA